MAASDRKKSGHREITTHVSIHTIHLDGLRELYRHFLRLPDGAVVEVSSRFFGSNFFQWVVGFLNTGSYLLVYHSSSVYLT